MRRWFWGCSRIGTKLPNERAGLRECPGLHAGLGFLPMLLPKRGAGYPAMWPPVLSVETWARGLNLAPLF